MYARCMRRYLPFDGSATMHAAPLSIEQAVLIPTDIKSLFFLYVYRLGVFCLPVQLVDKSDKWVFAGHKEKVPTRGEN